MAERIDLAAGDWTASVAPGIGGAVLSLEHQGRPILRPTPPSAIAAGDVRRTACFPLVPYANRIAAGRFRFDGAAHRLRPNLPSSRHPLHGIGWLRAWSVVGADPGACRLALRHRPVGGEGEDWPFAFEAEQTLSLDSTGLSFRLAVTNTDTRSAPIGLGWHPYFPRRPGEVLTFAAGGAWLNGPDLLPTCATDAREWDFGAGRRIGEAEIDNDFYSWDGRAILHADRGARVQLKADPLFGLLRLYTPPGTDFYAVEPVSHRADVINAADAGGGGMAIAAPGETLSGAMTIGAEGGG